MREVARLGRGEEYELLPEGELLRLARGLVPDPDQFEAGSLQKYWRVWEAYLCTDWAQVQGEAGGAEGLNGPRRRPAQGAQEVVGLLREGLKYEFVGVHAPGQEFAPDRSKKLRIVSQMLVQAGKDPEVWLSGGRPLPVQFANHRSTEEYADFVTGEVDKALRQGAVRKWEGAQPPTVVNGLRVVVQGEKKRLCINPMYVNAFIAYRRFRYERLGDMAEYVGEGDWLFTTDDKSGYWQVPVHPEMWGYQAFEWGGGVYFWPVLPFGFAPACRVYTLKKLELFRPLRLLGWRLTALIDDQATAVAGQARAQQACLVLVRLLGALGYYVSVGKCQLEPAREVRFLGLLVNAEKQAFVVPPDKVGELGRMVGELEGKGAGVTARDLARMMGKVVACSQAVARAPLYARLIGQALRGKASWDEALGDPQEALRQARVFLEVLGVSNGRSSWRKRPKLAVRVVGDASEAVYAALLPDAELGAEKMAVQFTEAELARMGAGDFSSTERELTCVLHAVRWLAARRPELLRGRALQYHTDSQVADVCLMGMRGTPPCLAVVEATYRLMAECDTEVEMVWRPRGETLQRAADALSKYEDGSQWKLHPQVFDAVVDRAKQWVGAPGVDCFADTETAKLETYFSRYWCEGTSGVDAMAQDWGQWSKEKGALYLFPPYDMVGAVLAKVLREEASSVVVVPCWPRWWQALFAHLPVRARWGLPHREDLLLPGSRLPNAARRRPHRPNFRLEVVVVQW